MTKENTEYPHGNAQNPVNNLEDAAAVSSEPITVNLDQDTYDALIEIYVNSRFAKESVEVFNDYRAAGESHIEALGRGAINEMVIETLTDQLARGEFEERLKEDHNKE